MEKHTISQSPILATKLYMPRCPSGLVSRYRLIEKMNGSLSRKLTIVSAPAGFGKSTLLSEWAQHVSVSIGWVSLDKGENDVIRFWSYVISALQGIEAGVGDRSLRLLQSAMGTPVDEAIVILVNDMVTISTNFVLILDDFHLIKAQDVLDSLSFLLARMPSQMHVCLASRQEVPLPLANLRMKGELVEIGTVEMRFTGEEIFSYWQQQVGGSLSSGELELLEAQTEGWVAGLQLTALSGKDKPTGSQVIRQFSGSNRFVEDYLIEEVFQHLTEEMQSFLLSTSILERMNQSLCTAVTGVDGQQMLKRLEQANLFLIPLDEDRYWYRYHHIFADFLLKRLKTRHSDQVSILFRKASEWFEQHQYYGEAIDYLLMGKDFTNAARLIEKEAPNFLKNREISTLHRWLEQLPESLMTPMLTVVLTWTHMMQQKYKDVPFLIEKINAKLEASAESITSEFYAQIVEEIFVIRNYLAFFQGDYEANCQLLSEMFVREVDFTQNYMTNLLFVNGIEQNDGSDSLLKGIYGFYGRVNKSASYIQAYSAVTKKHALQEFHFSAYAHSIESELSYEKNKLTEALSKAKYAIDVAYRTRNLGAFVPAVLTLAKIFMANGHPEEAIKRVRRAIEEIKDLYQHKDLHQHHRVLVTIFQAFLTRLYVEMGNQEEIEQWLKNSCITINRDISIFQEYENITFLRVLIFQEHYEEAWEFSQRLLQNAEQEGRITCILELNLLQAAILYHRSDLDQAVRKLHQALKLGEEEGYLRIFLNERVLLSEVMKSYIELRKNRYIPELHSDVSLRYVEKLYTLMGEDEANLAATKQSKSGMVSPLTKREMEVLGLLALGKSNKEIAEKLVLTEGTVKLHLNRIYSKLMCSNRIQALKKAKQLHLLP
ncbi:LuxR C-terminal-related transcriptional regulator [Brevibacillus sp. SYSU BS000544]|uniref:LuxR C-terminal-related transcriptional regulator n=1 Tax=Brevibacillus sp. SYSU BS000544 TaxID=3416443 RepID=UPI003CE4C96E